MKHVLIDERKQFYKGNMHCHSTLSDGTYTPEQLKAMYKERGYSFLAITDHEHLNNNGYLDDESFITITGAEFAIKQFQEQSTLRNLNMKVCHLNLYAKKQDNTYNVCYNAVYDHFSDPARRADFHNPPQDYERRYGKDSINALIRTANEHGFFVCYNHPRWSLENYGDYSGYEGLWGVEIFNTSSNMAGIYDYDINVLDDFLRDGKRILASCGDDNHNHREDSFGAFVMVNAECLSYDTIVDGLLQGNFYSSTGPLIHSLWVEGHKVHIRCSDAKAVTLSTFGRRAQAVHAKEGYLNEATLELKNSDIYFRLDVIDEWGRRANTQAYYLEELI